MTSCDHGNTRKDCSSALIMNLYGAFTAYPDPYPDGLVAYRNTLYGPAGCEFHTVYGILEACMGYANNGEYEKEKEMLKEKITIEELPYEDRDEEKIYDFQTVGFRDVKSDLTKEDRQANEDVFFTTQGTLKNGANSLPTVPANKTKEYLVQARRRVKIISDDKTIAMLRNALLHPWYDPYIGRACCIPGEPLLYEEKK